MAGCSWREETASTALALAPLVTMVSYSIVHRRGVENYLHEAARAGFDGLIVPDLPFEESDDFRRALDVEGLALVQMVTPVTPPERLAMLCRGAQAPRRHRSWLRTLNPIIRNIAKCWGTAGPPAARQ